MSNRGQAALLKIAGGRGGVVRLASELDVDHGYVSRILAGKRTPGLKVRRKAEELYSIPMQWWDRPATGPADKVA